MEAKPWRTLAWTGVAVFMASLDATILFVAFPSIRRSFPRLLGLRCGPHAAPDHRGPGRSGDRRRDVDSLLARAGVERL